jgi:hypothetical protein
MSILVDVRNVNLQKSTSQKNTLTQGGISDKSSQAPLVPAAMRPYKDSSKVALQEGQVVAQAALSTDEDNMNGDANWCYSYDEDYEEKYNAKDSEVVYRVKESENKQKDDKRRNKMPYACAAFGFIMGLYVSLSVY